MKKISFETISQLDPCGDRIDNYKNHYGDREFSATEFLDLDKITHKDKLWVAFRMMPKAHIKLAAADIAESVLHIYESKYLGDHRPRKAIQAARTGTKEEARQAAASADAASAYAASASASAADAASAATYAAYAASAAYATYADAAAAAYAAAAANAAAADAADAVNGRTTQESLQLKIVYKYWVEEMPNG